VKRLYIVLASVILMGCSPEPEVIHGYVDGEYLYIAATTSGVLQQLDVRRGQFVDQSATLFKLDDTELKASLTAAQSDIAHSKYQLNNLKKGQRPEDIEVLLKERDQANAVLENAALELNRAKPLLASKALSQSEFDKLEMDYQSSLANLKARDAQIAVARLGARSDEINAQIANVQMSEQKYIQIRKQLTDANPRAPAKSYVENTFFRPGAYVAAGKPVVSLLPSENIKVRFFVSQKLLPSIRHGQRVNIKCDGCEHPVEATVSFIASQAEFTPPVIFSNSSREKLVYMIEAIPDQPNLSLHPGQPVDIQLLPP